jgi:hypothetical protein
MEPNRFLRLFRELDGDNVFPGNAPRECVEALLDRVMCPPDLPIEDYPELSEVDRA